MPQSVTSPLHTYKPTPLGSSLRFRMASPGLSVEEMKVTQLPCEVHFLQTLQKSSLRGGQLTCREHMMAALYNRKLKRFLLHASLSASLVAATPIELPIGFVLCHFTQRRHQCFRRFFTFSFL